MPATGGMALELRAHESDTLPPDSCFASLAEASEFFEGGCIGYSVTRDACRLDGIRLQTESWRVRPLTVERVESSFFADESAFRPGSVVFDHALVMRDIVHQWHQESDLFTDEAVTARAPEPTEPKPAANCKLRLRVPKARTRKPTCSTIQGRPLPFIVLSKAFMLAADTKIADLTIVSQVKR